MAEEKQLREKLTTLRGKLSKVTTREELGFLEKEIFGRKRGIITLALKRLEALPLPDRKGKAKELNALKEEYQNLLLARRQALEARMGESLKEVDPIDITLELPPKEHGHLHLIPSFIEEVVDVFGRMGFEVAQGPEIETEEMNFDLLNFPKDHPARDTMDTFWLKEEGKLLRTHTSTIQIHSMRKHTPPFRTVYYGKCYRRDADATHSPMFHQFEALMIDRDLSLAHMKGVMIAVMRELIGQDAEFRFRASYFPFVEPGLEVDMRWQGNAAQSREGEWLEIAGCGMVHPNVLQNGGIDPKKWNGFAFAFGVDRMLMIRHQIPDIRSFYEGDLRFLRQF